MKWIFTQNAYLNMSMASRIREFVGYDASRCINRTLTTHFVLSSRVNKMLVEQYSVEHLEQVFTERVMILPSVHLETALNHHIVSFLSSSILAQHKDICVLSVYSWLCEKKKRFRTYFLSRLPFQLLQKIKAFPMVQ